MTSNSIHLPFILFLIFLCGSYGKNEVDLIFPPSFIWGMATAAYQIEGAYDIQNYGRNFSVWDTFSRLPNATYNGDTGDVACNHYERFKEDVSLLKELGVTAYRFSISWPRVLPSGRLPFNALGVNFYNNLIDELLRNGITPLVTLFHWDLPQALQDEYKGFLDRRSVTDFGNYADFCFQQFGDRVKFWVTFNEQFVYSIEGNGLGTHAPGRCSDRSRCAEGNSKTEPYLVAHHQILSHATAVSIYQKKYQIQQKGVIGVVMNCDFKFPFNPESEMDQLAAQRAIEFQVGWFFDPIRFGDYPKSMRDYVPADRLPKFTDTDKELLRATGSMFFGLNHYTSRFTKYMPMNSTNESNGWWQDSQSVDSVTDVNGRMIGKLMDPPWLYSVPEGFRNIVTWVWKRYNLTIYVTENGVGEFDPARLQDNSSHLNDTFRIDFYQQYLNELSKAMRLDGADVRGYMGWSLLDNFEWAWGYSQRFGIYYVDFANNQERTPKASALWWKNFLTKQKQGDYMWIVYYIVIPCICFIFLIGISLGLMVFVSRIRLKSRDRALGQIQQLFVDSSNRNYERLQ